MQNSKINTYIVNANFSTMKYVSIIALGFAAFVLLTDFLFGKIWSSEYLALYRKLDVIFALIAVSSVFFFWIFKIQNPYHRRTGTILFPLLILFWSAVVTGIDFKMMGLTTFLIVLLLFTFFLYLNLLRSVLFLFGACCLLLLTIYYRAGLDQNFLPLVFLLIPVIVFSVLMSARNFKNKRSDFLQQQRIIDLNAILLNSNENLEKEVQNRTHEIQIALEKAKESDRLKSAFLANVSHEIRTPMNGILGFSELLKEPGLPGEKQQEFIKIIEKSGQRMLNTINSIVEISKIETGLVYADVKKTNINNQLNGIYSVFKPDAEAKGLQLSYTNPLPDNESELLIDGEKFTTILSTLVKNAIKFTQTGSIVFGYVKKGSYLEFHVKDTGIGIPESRQKAVFEKFVQADTGDKRAYQGIGLGLAISRFYVEILGGKIWLESKEGRGTLFYFTIPYSVDLQQKTLFDNAELTGNLQKQPGNLKVLIVEDDETSARFITEVLGDAGHELFYAATGTEAVEFCRKNSDIRLVLMDIRMPDMDGHEATRSIREFNKDVVIIAQTAHGLSGDREKAIAAGCDDYISKPVGKAALSDLIDKYFK
jgi:signal transduction histidine kinase/CheY-like chemotaxis protein